APPVAGRLAGLAAAARLSRARCFADRARSIALVDARSGGVVVEVRHVHLHDHRRHAVLADVHRVAIRHRGEVGDALVLRLPLPDSLAHVVDPLADERALLVEVALVADRSVAWHERVLAEVAERFERGEPEIWI